MNKVHVLKRLQEIVEQNCFLLDGVDTYESETLVYKYTNWKTNRFVSNMDKYAEKNINEDYISGVDYVISLMEYIIECPDSLEFSKGYGTNPDSYILRRWVNKKGMIGLAYMKVFDLNCKNPVIAIHLDI